MAAKRTRKPVSSRSITAAQVDKFFAVFAATANVSEACRQAEIYRAWVYEKRREDAAFAARWAEAEEIATDALEAEARRRALEGVEKPVFYQGEECGSIREFSDTLMVILLKAHRPEKFKDRSSVEQSGEVTIRWAE
ncbi:MAG: hypothetical protein FD177_229 [Desulfovibrionaceae bacterium]|nr:MAG: hypothetical protein FD177_229 [Desulfovibrionaceae bacterium]